jgi:hypothetical protein
MSLDAITEKIAHFIGAFEMIVEESRMRAAYDEFRAARAAQEEARKLDLETAKGKQAHLLEDVEAKLAFKAPAVQSASPVPEAVQHLPQNIWTASNIPFEGPQAVAHDVGESAPQGVNYVLPQPSSLVSITYQSADLNDNDVFGAVLHNDFQVVAKMADALDLIVDAVAALQPLHFDLLPGHTDWFHTVQQMQTIGSQLDVSNNGPLQTFVATGAGALGTFINGTASAEFVEWNDLLPAFFARDLPPETASDGADDPAPAESEFAANDSPFKVEAGHQVVAGANALMNKVAITSTWLDAKVFAVDGDVVQFDAISQVNVLIDHDAVTSAVLADTVADAGSTVQNAARIERITEAAGRAQSTTDDISDADIVAKATGGKGSPDNWVVVRHEGPVVQMNWIKQYSFTTDFDQAHISLTGAATYLGFGLNDIDNIFNATETGFVYDLIFVGGNLIDLNLVSQLNILLDSDALDVNSAASDHTIGSSDHAASMAQTEGHASTAASTSGISVPDAQTDSDDNGATDQTTTSADHTVAPFSTGDNLLYNQASIKTIGLDTQATITQNFADALDAFKKGADSLASNVAKDGHFNGIDLLRVLYIDGDFTTVNMVDQVNILGDADQVHLARDDFAAALQHEIEVTTGSNILANLTALQDNGVDSVVMARGDTYSDALIYQANLIDTQAAPTGVNLAALATEAVAFLVDDIVPANLAEDIGTTTHGMIADATGHSDIMQGVLT